MKRRIVMLIVATMIAFTMPVVAGIATADVEGIQVEQAAEAHTHSTSKCTVATQYQWSGGTYYMILYVDGWYDAATKRLRHAYDHVAISGIPVARHRVIVTCKQF